MRWAFEDVGTPYSPCKGKWDAYACNELGRDGYMDLSLKFDTQAFVASLGEVEDREVVTLPLTGYLKDGTPIEGPASFCLSKYLTAGARKKRSGSGLPRVLALRRPPSSCPSLCPMVGRC